MARKGRLFVTVGSTKFDELIQAVLRPDVLNALATDSSLPLNISSLSLQIGTGAIPTQLMDAKAVGAHLKETNLTRIDYRNEPEETPHRIHLNGIEVEYFRFKHTGFADEVARADLIITHAGSNCNRDPTHAEHQDRVQYWKPSERKSL